MKSVRIPSFPGPYFPTFGLNQKRYGVSLRIQPECGKIRTRETPDTDAFHAVLRLQSSKLTWLVNVSFSESGFVWGIFSTLLLFCLSCISNIHENIAILVLPHLI